MIFLEDKINGLSPSQFQEKGDCFSVVPVRLSKGQHNSCIITVALRAVNLQIVIWSRK